MRIGERAVPATSPLTLNPSAAALVRLPQVKFWDLSTAVERFSNEGPVSGVGGGLSGAGRFIGQQPITDGALYVKNLWCVGCVDARLGQMGEDAPRCVASL